MAAYEVQDDDDALRLDVAEPLPGVTVVTARGDVELDTVTQFGECLTRQLRPGCRLVVDLSGMTLCGSVCIGTLFRTTELAGVAGADLWFVVPPGHLVARVLDMVGLSDRLRIAPDLGRALASD